MSCLVWRRSSDYSEDELISKLFANENIEKIDKRWTWSVKNKYYSSKVNICVQESTESVQNIGASIWYSTEASKADFDKLKEWNKTLEDTEIEVQLLVVDQFDCEDSKTCINDWCIKEGIEIIDFSEDEDNSDQNDVSIFASNSQKRIVEALQTVMWTQWSSGTSDETSNDHGTEKDVEDFETLFANLVNFKETASGLPDEERRKFAEKVAMSFYSALGECSGDESD